MLRRILTGPEDSKVPFAFERSDGSRFQATVGRRKFSSRASTTHRVLPSGFGYLRLTQWTLGVGPRAVAGVEALRDTPGLIIDLRGNPGGAVQTVDQLLTEFFDKSAELGRTTMTVRDLLALSPGEVLELDRAAGSPADLLVNGRLIARGEVVVVDEDFGLRVTEIIDESAAG